MEVDPDELRAVALSIRSRAVDATAGLAAVTGVDVPGAEGARGTLVLAVLSLARAVEELGLTVHVAAEAYAEVEGAVARAAGPRP